MEIYLKILSETSEQVKPNFCRKGHKCSPTKIHSHATNQSGCPPQPNKVLHSTIKEIHSEIFLSETARQVGTKPRKDCPLMILY